MFKESVLNRNLMFLLVVIGVAVKKLEFNAFLLRFDIFFISSLDSITLGIGNVICDDQKQYV